MEEVVNVIDIILRFIQDTNFYICVLEIFLCFLVLKPRKLCPVRLLIFVPFLIFTNNVIGLVNYTNKFLVVGKYFHFGYVLYFFVSVLLLWFCFDDKFSRILFFATLAYLIENTVYQLGNIIYLMFFEGSYDFAEYNSPKPIFYLLTSEILYILFLFFAYLFTKKKLKSDYDLIISNKSIILIECVVIAIIVFLNYYGTMNRYMNVVARYYAAIVNIFIILFECSLLNENALKHENGVVNAMLAVQKKQYKISEENIENINIFIHDIKKEIAALKTVGNIKDKESSLKNISEMVDLYEANVDSGNKALDIVLMEKKIQCKNHNIALSYVADGRCLDFMSNSDIYILFSNAIDNAIESVLDVEKEDKRNISILVSREQQWLKIEIRNYTERDIKFRGNLPVTTKKNKEAHGFGVKSIRNIIYKYKGNFVFDLVDNVFTLKIVFFNR